MISRILISTDGSDYSRAACAYGIYLAKMLTASVIGLYVIDIKITRGPLFHSMTGLSDLSPYQEFTPFIESGLEERGNLILEAFRKQCEKEGIRPDLRKVTGLIDETIIEIGKEADWIILAQRGEHSPLTGRGLLGSTSEAVVRKAGKPVMITPDRFREISRIGVAYDCSATSDRALHYAVELSRKLNRPLSIVSVVKDDLHATGVKARIDEILSSHETDGAITFRHGNDEEEILKYTVEAPVDLLVMGAYGRSRLRELILGSTTSYVIRNTTVPVLMIR
ncbi:MAG: universal stress protein [Deltaproteobacteria bacterium]|nr:universal stress protein [Deltaproteobacteria bacterium]